MRRLFPALLPAVCLPLAFLVVLSGQDPSGPRTRLVNSWVDTRGAGHLDFDVRGVAPGAVLTARLVLHRPPNGPTAAVRVTAASGNWSAYVNWLTNPAAGTARAVSELTNDSVSIDVSDEVRRDGLISFLLSNPAFATPPNVVLSSDAGADAPTLIVEEASDDPSPAASGSPGATPSPTPGSTANDDPVTTEPSTTPSSDSPSAQTPSPSAGTASGDPGVSDPQGPSDPTLPINLNPPPAVLTPEPTDPPTTPGPCTVSPLLVPSCGVWWGIGAVPLGGEGWNQAITDFDNTQNRSSDLLHYYHVGAANFPTPLEISRSLENGQRRVLLENWKPELGRTWAEVAAGDPAVDAEIDDEANYLRNNYTTPFFLAVHHEPENEIIPTEGSGYTAADYAAMYRHVVLRLKADGVTNAIFVMNYMGSPNWGEKSWFNDLYPGDDVVDWIAEDPYSIGGGGIWRADFAGIVNRRDGSDWPGFYTWATTNHPGKPLMLAEWGVTEDPSNPAAKKDFFNTMLSELASFPDLKGLVYWNSPGSDPGDGTRIDSDPSSLAAYQKLASSPLFHVSIPLSPREGGG